MSTIEKKAETKRVTPKEVLFEQMYFYRDKANKLAEKIAEVLKSEDKARGDILFQLYKLTLKNRELLIDIAHKLAPFEHPRLESVEVKSEVEHRYVIRAPIGLKDTNQWLKDVGGKETPLIVTEAKELEDVSATYVEEDTSSELLAPESFDYVKHTLDRHKKRRQAEDVQDIFVPPSDRFEDLDDDDELENFKQ